MRKISRVQKSSLLILISVLQMGCSPNVETTGMPITNFGEYMFEDGTSLRVRDDGGLINYAVKKNTESWSIYSYAHAPASVFHKWLIVWDGRYLWFASGDIGGYVWIKQEDGMYGPEGLVNLADELENSMPGPIAEVAGYKRETDFGRTNTTN